MLRLLKKTTFPRMSFRLSCKISIATYGPGVIPKTELKIESRKYRNHGEEIKYYSLCTTRRFIFIFLLANSSIIYECPYGSGVFEHFSLRAWVRIIFSTNSFAHPPPSNYHVYQKLNGQVPQSVYALIIQRMNS